MTPKKTSATAVGTIVPITHAPAYELVVDQIRRAIHLGRYLPGEKLPPERDLAGQLGVSRTTVREAVRLLEGEGLLTIRRGATGGLIVSGPHKASAQELRSRVQKHQKELADIFDYRLAVECCTARLAAERRAKSDIRQLDDALQRMESFIESRGRDHTESISQFNAADADFHIGIALAAKNPYLVEAVEEIRTAMFLPVGAIFNRLRTDANAHHDVILAAIRDQDGELASTEMAEHIEDTRLELRAFLRGRKSR